LTEGPSEWDIEKLPNGEYKLIHKVEHRKEFFLILDEDELIALTAKALIWIIWGDGLTKLQRSKEKN
jgi:hypothetical protein